MSDEDMSCGFEPEEEDEDYEQEYSGELDDDDELDLGSSQDAMKAEKARLEGGRAALTSSGILKVRDEKLEKVMDILCVKEHIAEKLLDAYSWNDSDLLEKFYQSPDACFAQAGIDPNTFNKDLPKEEAKSIYCTTCFEETSDFSTVPCSHTFCKDCWRSHISINIKEGNSFIKCMHAKCKQTIPTDLVRSLMSEETFKKYILFASKKFVEKSNMKWCPAPGCNNAVEEAFEEGKNLVGKCLCGYRFCYVCLESAHTPASCEQLKKWKTKTDSESYNWIATNTKGCPKCAVPTEKHDGCFQMSCRLCKHQWCWLCSADWATHANHFTCSTYKESKIQNTPEWREDASKDVQRRMLDRYLHYYNRFMEHFNSLKYEKDMRKKAREKLKELQSDEAHFLPIVEEGLQQLLDCRRTLQWTYVRAFCEEDDAARNLFEFQQSSLEMVAEKLSRALDLPEVNQEKINDIRSLTKVARSSLQNLFLS